jgi:tetratricopeptide (TPR) repeat protein
MGKLEPHRRHQLKNCGSMDRCGLLILCLAFIFASASAQRPGQSRQRTIPDPTQNGTHHPVNTRSGEAQHLFDQGLELIYAFDYSGAANSFRRAATVDPKMAMAYWGVAFSLGSDYYYHSAGDPAREQAAYESLQKAVAFSGKGPEAERDYVAALSKRYCNCPNPNREQQAIEFKQAMHDLAQKYFEDVDAATLYAQSIMNLHPWSLWDSSGTPWEGTSEILSVLESVLKRNPRHLGAVHYYIHAIEGSPYPERALESARLLPSLAPTIGHIVHMPAHIYVRTGDYIAAEDACAKAAHVDEKHLNESPKPDTFTILSYFHDLYFQGAAASMDGHYVVAKQAAERLAEEVKPQVSAMPQLQPFLDLQPAVLVRFSQWTDILQLPASSEREDTILHFARGMAFAATGKNDQAMMERRALAEALERSGPDETYAMSPNKTRDVLKIASDVLEAKLAMDGNERRQAIAKLRDAVALQDSLQYAEPPSWFYPVRESLGAALFLDGQLREAEQIFREDLQRNPRNPRSLFGLLQVLRSLGRSYDVTFVQAEFDAAWKGDTHQLDLRNF